MPVDRLTFSSMLQPLANTFASAAASVHRPSLEIGSIYGIHHALTLLKSDNPTSNLSDHQVKRINELQ
jgi:hypothetical protein